MSTVRGEVQFEVLDGDPHLSTALGNAFMNAGNTLWLPGDAVGGCHYYSVGYQVHLAGLVIAGGPESTTSEARTKMTHVCDCVFNLLKCSLRTGEDETVSYAIRAAKGALGSALQMCQLRGRIQDGLDLRLVKSVEDLSALLESLG